MALIFGADQSGNNNYWTSNNLTASAGSSATTVSFTTVGSTTWNAPVGVTSVNYLVVAGGGGSALGGGGAGGMLTGSLTVTPGSSYNITIGGGGNGAYSLSGTAASGGNSSFASIVSTGGGYGGSAYSGGGNGGSGGGNGNGTGSVGSGIAGQGNNGSNSYGINWSTGGGGGGASAAATQSGVNGGNGGAGLVSSISGSSVTYAGGGGGGGDARGGANGSGGAGGGGNGSTGGGGVGTNGLGGGAGGGGYNGSGWTNGATGGSGIVILSYTAPTGLASIDSMVDVPGITSTSSQQDTGGVVRGNYATLNPLTRPVGAGGAFTVGQGNLQCAMSYIGPDSTIAVSSGKWYWEVQPTGGTSAYNPRIGIVPSNHGTWTGTSVGDGTGTYGYTADGSKGASGSYTSSWGSTYTDSDIIGVALDLDNNKLWFRKNGVWQASGDPVGGANPAFNITAGEYYASVGSGGTGGGLTVQFNFGQRPFSYVPPAGFKSICTTNLPNPVIKRPSEHFDTKLYSGNGSSLQVGTNPKQTAAFGTQSLRFTKNLTQYLSQTPKVTGNNQKFTVSVWVKRPRTESTVGQGYLWVAGQTGTNRFQLDFYQNGIEISQNNGSWVTALQTAPVNALNDYQNWHHHVLAVDSTQASATNRVKYYIDGVLIKNDVVSATYMPLNQTTPANTAGVETRIGYSAGGGGGIDAYMSEFYQIDGQQLPPTAFGAFDANNNWMPIKYTGTYGTNGSYVPMAQPTTAETGLSYAGSFNGSNQYLQATLPATLSGQFTIEAYVYRNSAINGAIFTLGDANTSTGLEMYIGSTGTLYQIYSSASQISLAASATGSAPNVGGWAHVAVTRDASNVVRLFLDGVQVGSTWTSTASFSNTLRIGVEYYAAAINNNWFNGYISNFRIVNGTALYTSTFTPPTSALTAVSGTAILTLQSATVVDNSSNALSITNNNTVTTTEACPWQRTVGYDASGNNNNWLPVNYDWSLPRPTVLTYGVPGTYTWTAPAGVTSVKALVIAGGGAGGNNGGGGGAGGMIYNSAVSVTPGNTYTVTVGAGGAPYNKGNAQNSVFSSLTAIAGGNGCNYNVSAAQNGGSGGGGMLNSNAGGTGTAGQGNAGGTGNNGNSGNTYYGAGGGGAGSAGVNGTSGGAGGTGLLNTITGIPTYYAGGGGGNYYVTNSPGFGVGVHGGGQGQSIDGSGGGFGSGRSGSGGGGGASGNGGGNGGSGVVILSYANAYSDGINTGTGTNTILNQSIINDGPTDSAAGGSFCEWDAVSSAAPLVPSVSANDNLLTLPRTDNKANRGTIGISTGKWYWEIFSVGDPHSYMGVTSYQYENDPDSSPALATTVGRSQVGGGVSVGFYYKPYTSTAGMSTLGASGITSTGYMGFALDCDAGTIGYYWNNTLIYTDTSLPRNTTSYPYIGHTNTGTSSWAASYTNFGQRAFRYTPPTGYNAISTKNLKNVGGYNLPDNYGNFVNTPDLVWTKARTGGSVSPRIYDTTRGPGVSLGTNSTGAHGVETNAGLSAFLPNGFQLYSPNGAAPYGLENGYTYAAWCWNKGKTPGFDIVSYSGNGTTGRKVPHSLGQVPACIWTKRLDASGQWGVYHKSLAAGTVVLMLTNAASADSTYYTTTTPDASGFYVGTTVDTNATASSYVSYVWAEVPGFSKFGSYTGNATSPGPFIHCGFKPAFVLIKGTSASRNWVLFDNKRTTYNSDNATARLKPNDALVEDGNERIDFLSNGFKLNTYTFDANAAETYIYMAFAEAPFKYANAR